ncbi:hypothetical protein C8F04DRAFT_1318616 [Mycena alexandri]|uniref:Uncharacterized protein n=1 Tax=Mycena alexandri TaxID=1745969 RepID=A0AAD6S3L9_9AGAR|nr:hypothetical protein C8F04DRAFT_1318616 [Mycena alexandri]
MVDRVSTEVHILEFLNKHTEADNPAIPVLDSFPLPDNTERLFIIMPRMRNSPFFKTVRGFVEFFQQVLETSTNDGVEYISEKGEFRELSESEPFMYGRTAAGLLDYYFIDFSHPVQFPSFESRGLVTGNPYVAFCRRGDFVAELSVTVPYDPLKVDMGGERNVTQRFGLGELIWDIP